ncbi:MAG: DUF1080 domain-containing protein [Acetobacteraceae bacterium]|nr:DUF1080 domain-containing protein [Acetobacteraceae bacterium]
MQRRTLGILLAGGLAAPSVARAQGWTPMFNGRDFEGWNRLGNANWRMEGAEVVADRGSGFLVSQRSYGDFEMRCDFYAEPRTNSGIFIRASDPNRIAAATSYEVNIWDERPEQRYGTGAIVDVAPVNPMPRAGNRWNTLVISARGDALSVVLNGQRTVDNVRDARFASGPIALQHAAGVNNDDTGVIRFRGVEIRTL